VPIFTVTYAYDQRRDEQDAVRPQHRAFLRSLHDQGVLLASGPWAEGPAGAMIVLSADDGAAALAALDPDPFRSAGFIAERTVRGWNPVIGPWG
jgi:uncharacterized protein YciI